MSVKTLLIAPPFLRCDTATLGLHLLQAYAQKTGFEVKVNYQNLRFASRIGLPIFQAISWSKEEYMLGERIFCQAAFDLPKLGKTTTLDLKNYEEDVLMEDSSYVTLNYNILCSVAEQVDQFIEDFLDEIADQDYQVVGCTTMFQLNASAIALLQAVKQRFPHIVTIIGGANCAGELAKGVASLSDQIDYVFSGESEATFVNFLRAVDQGTLPKERIIQGVKIKNLDDLPPPDFSDFYEQLNQANLDIKCEHSHIPYEASRGCWWGEIHRCKFCSVHDLRYRHRSAERIIEDMKGIMQKHFSHKAFFTDDIMPNSFFKELYPNLKRNIPDLQFFSTQKANMSLKKMQALAKGGGYMFLPGLEALSTDLLKLMDKGVTARQNIAMLRYSRSSLVYTIWYLLYGFPQDQAAYYQSYLQLLPLMHHLNPPRFYIQLQILKFGVYKTHPEENQVSNIRPWKVYDDILPPGADKEAVAYYYDADYPSVLQEAPELIDQIGTLVSDWRAQWTGRRKIPPTLQVDFTGNHQYRLIDTRNLDQPKSVIITEKQVTTALVARPLAKITNDWDIDWGLDQQMGIVMDDWWVPLATAHPRLLAHFEQRYKTPKQSQKITTKSSNYVKLSHS